MNVICVSPSFPPQFARFSMALRAHGVTPLGLGDTPWHELADELKNALQEYVHVADLDRSYESALRAVAYLTWKHGRIDRIESHNEHWLGLDARLREDFNVLGPRPAQMGTWRTKSGMAEVFRAIGIPRPDGLVVGSPDEVRAFARVHGFPLVFKPNQGVGAASTYPVSNEAELNQALAQPLEGYLVQPFVTGDVVSYDGLADAEGRIVFETSHEYSSGIMQVVNERKDFSYWNVREIPAELRDFGRRTVAGFGVRERFFHIEFFRQADGRHQALEINVRPPGGFTTDMMNYAADVDVYDTWARLVAGQDVTGLQYAPKYHVLHASRRAHRQYLASHDDIVRRVGSRLLMHRAMPGALAMAMGEEMYLLRDTDLATLRADADFIQAT